MTLMSEKFSEPKDYCYDAHIGAKAQAEMHEQEMGALENRDIGECIKYGCMERGTRCVNYGITIPFGACMAAGCFLASIPGMLATLTCGMCTAARCIVCCGDEQSGNLAASTVLMGSATGVCCATGGLLITNLAASILLMPSSCICPEVCTCHQNYQLCAQEVSEKIEKFQKSITD